MNDFLSTLLRVHDDPNDGMLFRRAKDKSKLAYPLQVMEDGEAAVVCLSGCGQYADRNRHPLSAFLLPDLKLLRKSGFEVLAWLRQQPDIKHAPAAILTSSQASADIRADHPGANP